MTFKKQNPDAPPPNVSETDLARAIGRGYPSHEEALQVYIEMGPNRSLALIVTYFEGQKRPHPSYTTLKSWSAKYCWKKAARDWDVKIAVEAEDAARAEQIEQGTHDIKRTASKMRGSCDDLLNKIKKQIPSLKLSTGGEIKAAVDAAVMLSKAAEVMTGGVSDRTESRQTLTIAERKTKVQAMVDDVFDKVKALPKGQDNGQRTVPDTQQSVGNARDAVRSAGGL